MGEANAETATWRKAAASQEREMSTARQTLTDPLCRPERQGGLGYDSVIQAAALRGG